MGARRWYAVQLIGLVAMIGVGSVISIPSVRGWHVRGPFFSREPSATGAAATHARSVRHQQPSPAASTPTAATSVVDSAPPLTTRKQAPWVPSDRQALRDHVYLAGKEDRPHDAIVALEGWDAAHPGDAEVLRELARLLMRTARQDDAFARYRELLASQPDTGIRAEYAAALLAAQQYDSAAAEYRVLVAADSESVPHHLGLGRALAWGNHSRESEPELHWLVSRLPDDTTLVAMLRVARGAYDPTSAEATAWVSEDARFTPYRLALARAHVREQHAELAAAQFDTVVVAAGDSASGALLREAAGAHATAGDSLGNARLIGRAVAIVPLDLALRRSYAEALAWSGDHAGAIAQYDTLLAGGADAGLLVARGRLHAWSGNATLAERDLVAAVSMLPAPDAWVMLGDLYRWRGDRANYGTSPPRTDAPGFRGPRRPGGRSDRHRWGGNPSCYRGVSALGRSGAQSRPDALWLRARVS